MEACISSAVSVVSIWSLSMLPYGGNWARAILKSSSQSRERISALPQCRNASRTVTTSTARGRFPFRSHRSITSALVVISATPFTRNVSSTPGMKNSNATCGFRRMFAKESRRLLPGQSGIASVTSSRTSTKPGSSPRGAMSAPRSLHVPRHTKGERAMKPVQC